MLRSENTPANQRKMNEEDLERLFRRYAEGRSISLRNQIVEGYLYIASIIAKRFAGRGVDYDDLYQVASLALVKAVERFDPAVGVKFSSFATPTMAGEVKNYFRDRSRMIRLPRRSTELFGKLDIAKSELEQTLMRSPTVDELAKYTGIPEEEVLEAYEMSNAVRPSSLDAPMEEAEEASLYAVLGFEDSNFDRIEIENLIEYSLSGLTNMERDIIVGRYFENQSQRDLAVQMKVSQMTISRVERRALAAMRARMER